MINLREDQILPVPIDDPMLVKHMLKYRYGLDYLKETEEEEDDDDFTSLHTLH
jgi:hypothetical protein